MCTQLLPVEGRGDSRKCQSMIWLLKVREAKQGDLFHCSDSHQTGTACAKCPWSCILLGKPWDEFGVGSEQSSQVEIPRGIGISWRFLAVLHCSEAVPGTPPAVLSLSSLTCPTALFLGPGHQHTLCGSWQTRQSSRAGTR